MFAVSPSRDALFYGENSNNELHLSSRLLVSFVHTLSFRSTFLFTVFSSFVVAIPLKLCKWFSFPLLFFALFIIFFFGWTFISDAGKLLYFLLVGAVILSQRVYICVRVSVLAFRVYYYRFA